MGLIQTFTGDWDGLHLLNFAQHAQLRPGTFAYLWFPKAWEAESMHIYSVSSGLGSRIYAYLFGFLRHKTQNLCIFMWCPKAWDAESMHIL